MSSSSPATFSATRVRLLLLATPFIGAACMAALAEAAAKLLVHRAYGADVAAAGGLCLLAGILSVLPMAARLTRGAEAVLRSALLGGIILLTTTMAMALLAAAAWAQLRNEAYVIFLGAFYLAQLVAESAVWTWIIRRPALPVA